MPPVSCPPIATTSSGGRPNSSRRHRQGVLGTLPETDKRSYIDQFRLEERCVNGRFPFAGTTLDESSGSTGRPYDWIRSERERSVAHRNIGFFARYTWATDRS